MRANDRTQSLLAAALRVAERVGWREMTRAQVAAEADCSEGLVTTRLGTMDAMRRSVMRAAIRQRSLAVLAQGLAVRDRHALAAPSDLKIAASKTLCR